MVWTEEKVSELKKLWGDGLSCSKIAKVIGAETRSMIIGKVHRLGLSRRSTSKNGGKHLSRKQSSALIKAQRKAGKAPLGLSAPKPKPEPKQPPAFKIDPLPPEPVGIARVTSVLELEDHHCRWPIGEVGKEGFGFCGARKIDGAWQPYCAHHLQTGTTPRVARQVPAAVPTRQFLQFERA